MSWGEGIYDEVIDGRRYQLYDYFNEAGIIRSVGFPINHQVVLGNLMSILNKQLKQYSERRFIQMVNVRLNADKLDNTAVIPDVIIGDRSKFEEYCYNGAPDMIIEILSPETVEHDNVVKLGQYMTYKVLEYWIVDPEGKTIDVHLLRASCYETKRYSESDIIPINLLDGHCVNLIDIFANLHDFPAAT